MDSKAVSGAASGAAQPQPQPGTHLLLDVAGQALHEGVPGMAGRHGRFGACACRCQLWRVRRKREHNVPAGEHLCRARTAGGKGVGDGWQHSSSKKAGHVGSSAAG